MRDDFLIEYRTFRNSDPPELVRLWSTAQLGRGAATGISVDAFDHVNFAQPYFDPNGLLIATDDGRPVGFVHAGFGTNEARSDISRSVGVICAIVVEPEYRMKGIGSELLHRAENYLHASGAATINAGPSLPHDPFFFGIYGGARPSGFLQSDVLAEPFFIANGYKVLDTNAVYQRDVLNSRDPVDFKLNLIRRKTKLEIFERPASPDWWWYTRIGRLDSLLFALVPKSGGDTFAAVTVIGLDFYSTTWPSRAIGLIDLVIADEYRDSKYGLALLSEVSRRLRSEMVGTLDAHVSSLDHNIIKTFDSAGFVQVDTGVVYHKQPDTIDFKL